MQAICNCRTLPATVGVGRLPSWCHNSGKDSITVNLSFRFEESKQYQSYPACLPSTLERRTVLSEGTLYFAQTTDRISKKQQTALYATMFVNSLGRDRTLPLSYLYFLLHTVLNKIQYRIHRKYYPEQYLFEIRYHQTVSEAICIPPYVVFWIPQIFPFWPYNLRRILHYLFSIFSHFHQAQSP